MLQLIYVSTAVPGFDPNEVEKILATSRRNNSTARVTGMLIQDGRRFLQVLEGDDAAVEETYTRVRLDPRHRAVVKLGERAIEKRDFPQWAMASERVGAGRESGDLVETVDAMVAGVTHASTRELLRSFIRTRRAAA